MDRQAAARSIRRLARLLDSAFTIPVLGWRVGLDPIIGLLPAIGDLVSLGLSLEIVRRAARAGAPRGLLLKMVGNVALDFAAGLLPVLGDLADVALKANTRNARLFDRWAEAQIPQPTPRAPARR